MLILRGKLRGIVEVPSTTNKKTGEVYRSHTLLQIECLASSRGVPKIELHNITVADPGKFTGLVDKPVELAVRAYAPGQRVSLVQAD